MVDEQSLVEAIDMESRFAVRHTPPVQQDPVSTIGGPTQVRFLRFAVRRTPPDEQDPISNMVGRTQGRFLHSVARQASSIACSVQALPINTTTHSVPTQPVGSP